MTRPPVTGLLANYTPADLNGAPTRPPTGGACTGWTPADCKSCGTRPDRGCSGFGFHKGATETTRRPRAGETVMHYPKESKATTDERSWCHSCPVQDDCRRFALVNDVTGLWGGTTAMERQVWRETFDVTPVAHSASLFLPFLPGGQHTKAERHDADLKLTVSCRTHHANGLNGQETADLLGVSWGRVRNAYKRTGVPCPWDGETDVSPW